MGASLADHLNRLPYRQWVREDQDTERFGLPAEEMRKALRAGRRRGAVTVRRENGTVEYMRIWRLT
jgi:hypothetical protein